MNGWIPRRTNRGARTREIATLDKAPGAARHYEYSKQGKLHLVANGNGLSPWFETYDRKPLQRGLRGPRPEHHAMQQLAFFLLYKVRFRLAKCRRDDCGTYFLLSHWNRRYQGGTLCKSCGRSRSEENALKATADVRKWAKSQLHDFAANKFAKQIRGISNWHQQKELKDRIASFLNTKIARSDTLRAVYKTDLTGKWVAHPKNWKQIEATLNGGK